MEIKITNKSKTVSVLTIKADTKEWKEAIEKVYEKQKGKYEVQGFRKGKVPQKVIEQNYGNTIFWEDAIAEVANEGFRKAIAENKEFDPVGSPSLNVEKVDDMGVELTITTEIVPEIKLAPYIGLTVEVPKQTYDKKMLDEELKHAQIHRSTDKPVEGKVSAMGDVVVIDFVGSVDGKEFDGGKAENHKLELGSKTFIDTFEEQLVGHKAGDKVDVNVTFPKNYGATELSGKKALFKCEIKSVNEKVVPELNDEFAKNFGFDKFEDYKKDVEDQIKYEIEQSNKNAEENVLIDTIVKNTEVTLPDALVKQNLDHIMKDFEYRLAYQGLNIEDYAKFTNTTVEQIKESHKKDAENLAKTKLVLEALVKAENLSVSDADADKRLEEIAKNQNKSLEEVKKTFDSHMMDRLFSDILMSKLVDFLKSKNTIKAVAPKKQAHKCECGDDCHCHDDECECGDDCKCGDDCECKKEQAEDDCAA